MGASTMPPFSALFPEMPLFKVLRTLEGGRLRWPLSLEKIIAEAVSYFFVGFDVILTAAE
jgi:hypothetical protein